MSARPCTNLLRFTTALVIGGALQAAPADIMGAAFDILDPGDPGYGDYPSNALVLDDFLDVSGTDFWTLASLTWTRTDPRIRFAALPDPQNPPNGAIVVNPGTPLACSISRSLPRDGDARWTAAGAVGSGSSAGGADFHAVWTPDPAGAAGVDGYVAHIVILLEPSAPPRDQFFVSVTPPPPNATLFASAEGVYATFDNPAAAFFPAYLWTVVPEPSTGMLCIAALISLGRRR